MKRKPTDTITSNNAQELQDELNTPESIAKDEQLRQMVAGKPKRLKIILKVLFYGLEFWGITLMVQGITATWLRILTALILGIILTKLIDWIIHKIELRLLPPDAPERIQEVHHETRMDVADSMIKNFALVPELLKEQFISSVFRTESARYFIQIQKQKRFKNLILAMLQGRQAIREGRMEDAHKILSKILKKIEEKDYPQIYEETNHLVLQISS